MEESSMHGNHGKENLKRLSTVRFPLRHILEKVKLWRSKRTGGCLDWGEERWRGRAQSILGDGNALYGTVMMGKCHDAFVKTQNVQHQQWTLTYAMDFRKRGKASLIFDYHVSMYICDYKCTTLVWGVDGGAVHVWGRQYAENLCASFQLCCESTTTLKN